MTHRLTEIINYEIELLGPQDQIEGLRALSSWAFAQAEAIEAEEELLNFEAGLAATEDDPLITLAKHFSSGDYDYAFEDEDDLDDPDDGYCEDCNDYHAFDDDELDYESEGDDICLECRVENLERRLDDREVDQLANYPDFVLDAYRRV